MEPPCSSSAMVSNSLEELVERWTIDSTAEQALASHDIDLEIGLADPLYLDPNLWKYLPDELLDQIRSMLPFRSLLRFCVVCRSWMLAILGSDHVGCNPPKRRTKGLLIQLCNHPVTAFNSGRWESLPKLAGPGESFRFKVVASAGGLLCMRSNVERELVVWNPVTRRVRHLQIPPIEPGFHDDVIKRMSLLNITESYYRIGLVYDSAENCYRIIVALVMNGVPGVTLVYYSGTKSWTRAQAVPEGFSFFLNALSSENAFFCAMHSDRRMLLEYHVQHETWTATLMPITVSSPKSLIRIKGEVMLLTEIRQTDLKVDKIFVFQLTGESEMIEEILPQTFVRDVFKAASTSPEGSTAEVQCLVEEDVVFFVAMSMGTDSCWFRLRRESTFMRVWIHDAKGQVSDSDWSSIGFKPDHVNWAYSCRMMRSDYSRLASLIIVPSLVSQP